MPDLIPHQLDVPHWHRWLLPSDLMQRPGGRRSARDWVVDVIMFLVAAGIGVANVADTWADQSTAMLVVDIAAGAAVVVSLWWRRSQPLVVAVLAVGASVFAPAAAGAALIAAFNGAIRLPLRSVGWIAVLAGVAVAVSPVLFPGQDSYGGELLVGLLLTVVVIGWGLFARTQRALVHTLQDRTAQLESQQRLRVAQAREAERRRIAREMHDVLAHRVSLLSVHAGALEFHPDAPPEEIARAAGVIRASARATLQELRQVIGVLRDDGERDAPEPPQPTLGDIPALVEESRAAGMRVHLDAAATDGAAPPDTLGRSAYRIVQEGLTNARKHAPGAAVDVLVQTSTEELVVEVRSRRAITVHRGSDVLPGAGTGLIGLRERVVLSGGELVHGVEADGDFVLRATLPRPQ